ncbi:hypothetical protein G9A89_007121 [Geosiphon pyriformis]|nr:hypothetical protein G9A89_007121 [Geosiphon pyriformis]
MLDWNMQELQISQNSQHTRELGSCQMKITECEPTIIASLATANTMAIQKDKTSGTMNHVSLVTNNYWTKEYKIWQMANAKVEGATPSKILEIKNNPPETVNIVLISNPNAFLDLEADPEEFHEHYQNLAPTREEQKQHLAQINT